MSNHLLGQTSPYLLQHAENPVDWYPWCDEAFEKAKREDKPIFLSIGYSTCHWCHVMAHESFENEQVADLLNRHFVSIKVDKEERPDIDSVYMSVCQALTGSGGWPTSIFMTAQQKPFFAGTYFPTHTKRGMVGFVELLQEIITMWESRRQELLDSAQSITEHLSGQLASDKTGKTEQAFEETVQQGLMDEAVRHLRQSFDAQNGGFGRAPKFPSPHILLFLMECVEGRGEKDLLPLVEKTLIQMYRGGLFDHIGYGFSRYSTDDRFLVPHFEKMLNDNALLIMAYAKAFELTKNALYREIAEKTALYVMREMTSEQGGFYSAQDADSEGVEGKYYVFEPGELTRLLGQEQGLAFCVQYGITPNGNFEGKSIPNLLSSARASQELEELIPLVYKYRRSRAQLHLDDKILTSWNALMIAALCRLYRVSGKEEYLKAAVRAMEFLHTELCENDTLYVSYREGARAHRGFLDDYASVVYALIELYEATLDERYLGRAVRLCTKARSDFHDSRDGGFFLSGQENQTLILRPKETYDGATPSGNSLMAYNLVRLGQLTESETFEQATHEQLRFLTSQAKSYPAGSCFFLLALSLHLSPPGRIVCVAAKKEDLGDFATRVPLRTAALLKPPDEQHSLINGKPTFYVCTRGTCLAPVNDAKQALEQLEGVPMTL